ncbi:MAG: hypothetical protein KDE45_00780, partial [Caldilineaceae bacterium]|nr:hypothetical protein [Caldilineaceae bacterium]
MQLNLSKFADVAACRAWAADQIDAAAGRARARYLTTVPGQEATYTAKYAQAQAYIAAGYPASTTPYPWIAQEALRTGLTIKQTADRIKITGDVWANVVGPAIEGLRIGGKDSLPALLTIADVLTHCRSVIAALDGI